MTTQDADPGRQFGQQPMVDPYKEAARRKAAQVRLGDEWRFMAEELEKSAQALERHAENLRHRARYASEQAALIDGAGAK